MNKELINKYKEEFDYWLNNGEILYTCPEKTNWIECKPTHNWVYSFNRYIINDEYVEFRKALAEGNTVEYKSCDGVYADLSSSCMLMTEYEPEHLRIKPNEPQFKVGDWVKYIGKDGHMSMQGKRVSQVIAVEPYDNGRKYTLTTSNSGYDVLEEQFEPWQPQPGEWCWFYNGHTKNPTLIQYQEHNENLDLEPFIGTLPSHLKRKK